jgi:hypothetical protein
MTHLERYPQDIDHIRRVCAAAGLSLSPIEAAAAWEAHSETMAAGWLLLPADNARLEQDVRCALAGLYGVRP